MRTESSRAIRLTDYTPPDYLVDTVDLDVSIHDGFTRVKMRATFRRNEESNADAHAPLVLHGEDLLLESIAVDGTLLSEAQLEVTEASLAVLVPLHTSFVLETVVQIKPDENTQLSGLYRSKDGYFTQCEAEGFRRITYFLDRPDVMAKYTTTLHADKERFPDLLSNGNPVARGDEADGRHYVRWEDPFPKPSYLFAMVVAKLDVLEDHFVTMSGRRIRCAVYVEPGKLDRTQHAMDALKKAMAWDEARFGREMDLEHYMIVAVSDFNMGAMENKGLNIFNTKFVLARPDTATDVDFQGIDRVVAHEYFHNWSGNRVTCRDWFQLSLKEGLTVYRDQEFGADVHSRSVTRIQEVRILRTAQFPEDAGPMAHPIRPASYEEINNFYTPTVYEKGAEVVRMIATILGRDAFRKGMDLYFDRHDGRAVTCDDFVAAMQDATGVDLTQFKRWYVQAGTPSLDVSGTYDAGARTFSLRVVQRYPETAYERRAAADGSPIPRGPYHLPLSLGFLDAEGRELESRLGASGARRSHVLSVTRDDETFVFEDVTSAPIPSLLRGFSAPVILDYAHTDAELALLMAHDTDAFQRWESGQRLAMRVLGRGIEAHRGGREASPAWIDDAYVEAMRALLESAVHGDPALVAEAMSLPSEVVLAEATAGEVDPDAIHAARLTLRRTLADRLGDELAHAYTRLATVEPYSPDAKQAGARALRNTCLGYLAELESRETRAMLLAQLHTATNMTDSIAALTALAQLDVPERLTALDEFLDRWRDEALVVDKWLLVQSTSRVAGTTARVRALLDHPAFDLKNPNKVYALVRAFCASNPKHFHAKDGSGYALAADMVLALDPMNPQVAARIARTFDRWRRVDAGRREHAEGALLRIQAKPGLSRDVAEIVGKALEAPSATV